jgi:hypothetical protein
MEEMMYLIPCVGLPCNTLHRSQQLKNYNIKPGPIAILEGDAGINGIHNIGISRWPDGMDRAQLSDLT